jgi:hypothetical protein
MSCPCLACYPTFVALNLLILKYLSSRVDKNTLECLEESLLRGRSLPERRDWLGFVTSINFDELVLNFFFILEEELIISRMLDIPTFLAIACEISLCGAPFLFSKDPTCRLHQCALHFRRSTRWTTKFSPEVICWKALAGDPFQEVCLQAFSFAGFANLQLQFVSRWKSRFLFES